MRSFDPGDGFFVIFVVHQLPIFGQATLKLRSNFMVISRFGKSFTKKSCLPFNTWAVPSIWSLGKKAMNSFKSQKSGRKFHNSINKQIIDQYETIPKGKVSKIFFLFICIDAHLQLYTADCCLLFDFIFGMLSRMEKKTRRDKKESFCPEM